MRWGGMDWTAVARDMDRQQALESAVMNRRVTQNVGSFLARWETVSFLGRTLPNGIR